MSTRRVGCLCTALCLFGLTWAHAGDTPVYTIRLAVSEENKAVTLSGVELVVLDGDVRDVLLRNPKSPLEVKAGWSGLIIPGVKTYPRSVIFDSDKPLNVDGRELVGSVEIFWQRRRLLIINRLGMERYLRGVIGAEMGNGWPLEALKAQAVAARTFAMHRRLQREAEAYDLSATTLDQVYKGIGKEGERTAKAVSSTAGEVLTYGGFPAEALYHSCCGGRTRSAEEVFRNKVKYLVSVQDPDCNGCPEPKGHGVGMCQWGARGMAERGKSYREILRRYYPGTELRKMY